MTDEGFLRAILADPGDDATMLVYADWLEERGDSESAAKAEYLRLTVQLTTPPARQKGWRKALRKQLQQLAAGLDTNWLAVVSRLPIENCHGKRVEEESRPVRQMRLVRFDYLCDRRWDELRPTDERAVRFCDACSQNVHYCDTIMEARRLAQQRHCIAVDIGVIRGDQDLEPERMWLGRPSAETLRQEQERVQPDPVSAERERRKREQTGTP